MAMSLSPASEALSASSPQQTTVDTNNSLSTNSNSSSNDSSTTIMNDQPAQIAPSSGPKRKPSRRANTAERRATHNAVERQRRETLNGRFLDLAALLPNLSQIRRPSKSSIVNSSIAHIQASRRHRLVASRELKLLKQESDALRREVNEWRDRAGLPRVEEPVRGEAFAMVISGELEVIQGVPIEEEDESGEDGFGAGLPVGPMPGMPHHPQQQVPVYNPTFVDDVEDEVAMLGAMYAQQQNPAIHPVQQQNGAIHPVHLTQQHQMHQHMMAPEDPRIAMFLNNHQQQIRRERSESLSPGNQSPTYELHHSAMQDFAGVPRMGGMSVGPSFVPSHHNVRGQRHGMQVHPQQVGVNLASPMMMMMS